MLLHDAPHVRLATVDEFRAKLNRGAVAIDACSPHAASDPVACFQNDYAPPSRRQFARRCKPRGTSTDDEYVSGL
jgi:hypothetical protein